MTDLEPSTIKAWSLGDTLLEFYRYAPGPADALPKHSHAEYQFCLSLDFPGEYYYRGTHHPVPVGSLSVIHPGEMHSARDLDDRQTPATYRTIYIRPERVAGITAEVAGRKTSVPFFSNPIILDSALSQHFLVFHRAVENAALKLEQESLLLSLLVQLMVRYAAILPSSRLLKQERRSVQRVREYLQDNYAENVTLDRLAQIANLSPYHLNRVFSAEVGIPPHAYQTQVRIDRAKLLLSRGVSIKQVAVDTGFTDQSHLTRYFKRLIKVTPGQYRLQNSKNIQDLTV
jgi:AraC-like DNA-binding protein